MKHNLRHTHDLAGSSGRQRLLWIGLALLSILLSACSQETDLYLKTAQRWELRTKISLNFGMLPELRPMFEGFSIGIDTGQLGAAGYEAMLRLVAQYCESRGMRSAVRVSGAGEEKTYRLTIKGQGWEQLNSLAQPDPQLLNQAGYGQLASQPWPYGWTVTEQSDGTVEFLMQTIEDPYGLGMLFPTTFRLHGGEILRTNGIQSGRGTVTWRNPSGQLYALLRPGSGFNPVPILLILGLALLVGLLVRLVRRSGGRRCESCGRRVPRGVDVCPRCGNYV